MIFLILGLGYPLPDKRSQWCTERMKLIPQRRFFTEVKPVLTLLGVRAS
ncbi:hypothetical protein [Paenibacillus amylolyticus]|nr:hypothetical protein [Paenibacillus amylolyticus]